MTRVVDQLGKQLGEQILKLYQHMEVRFARLDAKIDTKADKSSVDRIYQLLDDDLKHREIDEQERLAMTSQLDRHEGWITQLAKAPTLALCPSPNLL